MTAPLPLLRINACTLIRQGRVREALALYNQAVAENPGNAAYVHDRAIVLIALDMCDDAHHECQKAVALNPRSIESWLTLGEILARLDRLPESARALERAVAIEPENAYAHALLLNIYQKMNHGDLAAQENRVLRNLVLPLPWAGLFFIFAAFMLGILLGGVLGVVIQPFGISTAAGIAIGILFCILCILFMRSGVRLQGKQNNALMLAIRGGKSGLQHLFSIFLVINSMIVIFGSGVLVGTGIWTWVVQFPA